MLEITSRGTLEATMVPADFNSFIGDLNLAATQGKAFVIANERRHDGETVQVALSTQNITRIRDVEEDAFLTS